MTPKTTTSLTIWEIERGLAELVEAREEAADEATRTAIDQALTEYVEREVVKVDGIRGFLMHCNLMSRAAKEEADLQAGRSRLWEKRAERLKSFCVSTLQAFGRSRVEGRTGKLVVRGNGGPRPIVITDPGLIPSEFSPQVVSYPLDKDKLRKALEAGDEVPGAHLGERGVSLIVK
jgi:hypothetical protein